MGLSFETNGVGGRPWATISTFRSAGQEREGHAQRRVMKTAVCGKPTGWKQDRGWAQPRLARSLSSSNSGYGVVKRLRAGSRERLVKPQGMAAFPACGTPAPANRRRNVS